MFLVPVHVWVCVLLGSVKVLCLGPMSNGNAEHLTLGGERHNRTLSWYERLQDSVCCFPRNHGGSSEVGCPIEEI